MARSAAGSFAQRVHSAVRARSAERSPARGDFLGGLAASLGLAACAGPASFEVPPRVPAARRLDSSSRIVVVGAGAAGTTCAYRLYQAGFASEVYDANSRAGGRTWTLRGFFADGQYSEHGGQLIATSQHRVRQLAAELGLHLVNLNGLYPRDAVDTYFIDGERYTHDQALRDYDRYVYGPLTAAAKAAGDHTTFYRHSQAGVKLDNLNVEEWLAANVDGGTSSKIAKLLMLACLSEYGGELHRQSALNLIYLFSGMRHSKLDLSGTGENDKYTIDGGNDQLVARMVAAMPSGTVTLGTKLTALARNSDGSYTCTFSASGSSRRVNADVVVLAIPFTVLREVDLSRAGFSARKRRAIDRLDLGSNAKVHLQFTSPYWLHEHYSGTAYGDAAYQDSWDISIGQKGRAGMLVCFPGGAQGTKYTGAVHGAAPEATAQRYLRSLESSLPGALKAYNGMAYQDFWVGDPLTRGAYSYYQVGQYTTLCGEERIPQQNVHFCGEQTSIKWQGYIDGAVESGERAAREILHNRGQ
jgi:monoamine oxidase